MGGAYVAVADDAYCAAGNPAGVIQLKRTQFSASFTRFFSGLDVGSISEGSFFFAPRPFGKNAFALAGSYLFQDIFSQMRVSFSLGRRILRRGEGRKLLALSVSADVYRVGYNLGNAVYDTLHGDVPDDPLFRSGTEKFAVGGGVSLFGKIGRGSFGLKVSNINEPNVSLSGDDAGRLPRRLRTGFAYDYRDVLLAAVDFDTPLRSATMQDPTHIAVGVEGRMLDGKLLLRGGYDLAVGEGAKGSFHLGFGFRSLTRHNFGFDYALVLPGGHVAGHPHHKVAVFYGMPIPPPKKVDLIVYPESLTTVPMVLRPDSVGVIKAFVANIGEDVAKNFRARAFYFDEGGNYGLIGSQKVDALGSGEHMWLEFAWMPPRKGWYDVYVSVDDVETKGSKRRGVLPDVNGANNVARFRVAAFNPPALEKKPEFMKTSLKLSEINYIREEIPMVPFVFFDHGDTSVPTRFYDALRTVVRRLGRNPNVAVVLRGYVDAPSEAGSVPDLEALALKRAQAVKNLMLSMGARSEQVIIVPPGEYDYTQPRAGKPHRRRTSVWESYIAQENRRVEMSTQIIGFPDTVLICCVNYRIGEVEVPPEGKLEIENSMRLTKDLLEQNPDVIILFHGTSSPEDGSSWENAFYRAMNVRNYAGQLVSPQTAERMMVYAAPDSVDMVKIVMSGDAIVYRPRSSAKAAQGFQVAAREKNRIVLEGLQVDAGIDTYYIAVVDDAGNEFRLLAAGRGEPPRAVEWDWHGNDGEPPEPGRKYYAYLYIRDKVGQELEARSAPVQIKVTRTEKRQELIIVNFTFGGTFPQSPYLEGRTERIASDFIRKAVQRKTVFKVVIGGHTDIIGNADVNQRLSLERARREYRNLRRILMSMLGLRTEMELDRWLAEHKVSIETRGYGYSRPYVVRVWERGYFRNILVGNNEYPEGRFINRRVTMEYQIIRRYK